MVWIGSWRVSVFQLSLMHANLRPGPPFKQRFEFGALEVSGSGWASDWLYAVRGLNELAHLAEAPCAGAPASVPCRSKESKREGGRQHLKIVAGRPQADQQVKSLPAVWRVVPLGSLRSPSSHNPPDGKRHPALSKEEKSATEENI